MTLQEKEPIHKYGFSNIRVNKNFIKYVNLKYILFVEICI